MLHLFLYKQIETHLQTLSHDTGLFGASKPTEFYHVVAENTITAISALACLAFLAPGKLLINNKWFLYTFNNTLYEVINS